MEKKTDTMGKLKKTEKNYKSPKFSGFAGFSSCKFVWQSFSMAKVFLESGI